MREVRVSSPDRVLWPAAGMADGKPVTKLDLAEYLVAVGDPMLRALGDRPITLQRFPEGIEGEEFLSKNPPKGMPDWVRTVTCPYPAGRKHAQLVIDEVATAVWAVQMNTVTFHPWPVRTANNDNPDELRIDLDPQPGRTFTDAVEAALALSELMRRDRAHRLRQDERQPRRPRLRAGRADARVPRRAARRHRHRPRARAAAARPRHHLVVEGGARRADLRRLQPGLPRPHHRLGLQPASPAGRAGVDAGDLERARPRSSPATSRSAPCPTSRGPRRRLGRHRRRGRRRRRQPSPCGTRTSTSEGSAS